MIRKIPSPSDPPRDEESTPEEPVAAESGGEAGRRWDDDEEARPEPEADEASEPAETPAPAEETGADLEDRLEAVIFAAAQPLSVARLAAVLGAELDAVKAALTGLEQRWRERPGAIDLVAIAGGYRFMTRAAFADDLAGLARKGKTERLSPAALETLAVVAYRQPIGRADVEAVRGVQCGPLLRVLLDRDLIRVTGRSPEPGHPLLYGTTRRFLDHFGLKSLKALPEIQDLLDAS